MREAVGDMRLEDFWELSAAQRSQVLWEAIEAQHRYHFERNVAYRQTLTARGVGSRFDSGDLARLLRPAALTFKSYIDHIGPFPQNDPSGFVRWLSDQLSIPLPRERWAMFRRRYGTLEALLRDVERIYSDLGLEIVTSTGTSGLSSFVARNAATVELAIQAFFTGIRRSWGVERGTALVFVMPQDTRVAIARVARFGTRQLDWAASSPVYYTMPFSATPDQLRIRAGRTFSPGLRGWVERRALYPFMAWANEHLAVSRYVALTLARLRECARAGQPLMLLGGLVQLHTVARQANVSLPPGSRVATGGGMKECYPFTPAQIRADLGAAFGNVPVSDVYGMAEANWAAFECPQGNYHVPPWVYAVVTGDDDRIVPGPDATGLLAFFDPVGGGELIPPFFQTADRVRLVNGGGEHDPRLACPCGYDSAYIVGGIQRVDLMQEAGCAAQI
jgi:hypothetical protein